jgi:ribulose-phosphate 3-epimerase
MLLGFAINPDTDLDHLRTFFELSNYVQVMGIQPGATGQKMLTQTPASVSYLRRVPNRRLIITVDGGVHLDTIQNLFNVGANYCVASSAIYDEGDWRANFAALTDLAGERG